MNKQMIHSMAFGRAFWLDEMTNTFYKDGTVDMEQQDYVGEWTDLEGVSLHTKDSQKCRIPMALIK